MRPRSRSAVVIAMALALTLALAGCTNAGVVAKVNGQPIKATDLQAQFDQLKASAPQMFEGEEGKAREAEYKAKILEGLIQTELIKQAAEKLGVKVSDKEVDDYLKTLESQYGGAEGLKQAMSQAGITTDQLKESVRNRLLYEALQKKVVKDEDISDEQTKEYYDSNSAAFQTGAQVHAAHILIKDQDDKGEPVKGAEEQAKKLLADVKGGADIAALAKQYSSDPGSKDQGGDLGWAAPTSYVAEFAQAVSEMKEGEVRLVQSTFGWHVIKLLGTKPAETKTYDEVKEQIIGFLQQERAAEQFATYMEDLEKTAKIEILDADLKKAIEGTATVSPTP